MEENNEEVNYEEDIVSSDELDKIIGNNNGIEDFEGEGEIRVWRFITNIVGKVREIERRVSDDFKKEDEKIISEFKKAIQNFKTIKK